MNGGPWGDLFVFLSVREHEEFTRRDYDIHSEQPVTFTQAALGTELETATVHGRESIRIPAGTQPGHVIRLRGKGVPHLNGSGRGDHYVHVAVRVPMNLSQEQRELLEKLAELEGEEPDRPNLFDKVKDFFGN